MGDIIKYRMKDFVPFKGLFEYSARTNTLLESKLSNISDKKIDKNLDIPKYLQENLIDEDNYIEGLGNLEKFLASNNITTSMTKKKEYINRPRNNREILKEIIKEQQNKDEIYNQTRKLEQKINFHKLGLYTVNGVYLYFVSLL
jgi:hypothetical protein